MRLIYNLSVFLYGLAIRIASPFHKKARLWTNGRKNWRKRLKNQIQPGQSWVWVHCASLGEFEQGRNLIELLRQEKPDLKILLTFFSPSGYEIRKNYQQADFVCYLPLDTPSNARAFLEIVHPSLAIFIKYEIWVNVILEAKKREIPLYLVSALVRENSGFFKSIFKGLYKDCFQSFTQIFTQNAESQSLLSQLSGNPNIEIGGDTRFDRVLAVRDHFEEVPGIPDFVKDSFTVVVGSSWPADEKLILQLYQRYQQENIRWIIAPHEIHHEKIQALIQQAPQQMLAYSGIKHLKDSHRLLWIDNIGMLSRLYHYGSIAYIGGGFGSGIHNTLEAVVFGNPVIFGPKYQKFEEATELIKLASAHSISTYPELEKAFLNWLQNPEDLAIKREHNRKWAESQAGATQQVFNALPLSS